MKIFQICWGYLLLLSLCKILANLLSVIFDISSLYFLAAVIFLAVLFLKIQPLEKSNYLFGFQVSFRFQH